MRLLAAVLVLVSAATTQSWSETGLRTGAGAVALDQAFRDVQADALFLLVASHPDDRYVLPAVWLRRTFGARVAILLASRGGGAQNSAGSETGDDLERIRTLEAEVGAAAIGADIWHLDRPDAGFRRSAAETFAEWGREATLHALARTIRRVRPDAVMTMHHAEEQHGHDLALVELLPAAVALAADAAFATDASPHHVGTLCLGSGTTPSAAAWSIATDRLDPVLGATLRRHAYEILRSAHRSPGPPASLDAVFESRMWFQPSNGASWQPDERDPLYGASSLPSLLDARWPGRPERSREIAAALAGLSRRWHAGELASGDVLPLLIELRELRQRANDDVRARLDRRIESLERLSLLLAGIQVEVEVAPGTVAVGGEEFVVVVRINRSQDQRLPWSIAGLHGVEATLLDDENGATNGTTTAPRASVAVRVPRGDPGADPMAARFRAEHFEPPVQLRVTVRNGDVDVPVDLRLPIEQRPPVELHVVPRTLLLSTARRSLQFRVVVTRNSRFPIAGELEVRGASGYALTRDRLQVALDSQRSETFGFEVQAPAERRPGVDVLRIRMGNNRVELPVHKIDIEVPSDLRVGVVRSRDDTLSAVLGAGGLGIPWSDLSDSDVALADLSRHDTIVVDIRALHDRPAVRSGFRRLLEFAQTRHRRLVVFYQKDVEFQPPGEGFVGAPFLPFQVGKARVTRADAPVTVLLPAHVLLTHPNAIRPGDWDGWEQERGLYLPSVWASQFEELLEMNDPGQPPERGALLHARTGDGEYVYCALSLWRQLKKLHPGAVRLLANLLTPAGRT